MADKTEKRDYRQETTDRIIAAIENGTAPWQRGWDSGSLPFNPTTEKEYRGGNTLRLMLEGRADPRWMTYKQAEAEGWQVRKGEHAVSIEYWKFDRVATDDKSKTPASPAPQQGESGEEVTARERAHVFFARVFNAEQIDGIPPLPPRELQWSPVERAEKLLAASGVEIVYGGDRAFYRPNDENVIHLPARDQFKSDTDFYATALHELSHWSGHSTRLDRPIVNSFGTESYAKEELRAEIAAAFISAEAGLPRDIDNNAAYVASWVAVLQNDKNEIFRAASDAQKIADFVFEREREHSLSVISNEDGLSDTLAGDIPETIEATYRREDLEFAPTQTVTVVGLAEEGTRVLGRSGAAVVSVSSKAFESTPNVGDKVIIKRVDGHDRATVVPKELALGR